MLSDLPDLDDVLEPFLCVSIVVVLTAVVISSYLDIYFHSALFLLYRSTPFTIAIILLFERFSPEIQNIWLNAGGVCAITILVTFNVVCWLGFFWDIEDTYIQCDECTPFKDTGTFVCHVK